MNNRIWLSLAKRISNEQKHIRSDFAAQKKGRMWLDYSNRIIIALFTLLTPCYVRVYSFRAAAQLSRLVKHRCNSPAYTTF